MKKIIFYLSILPAIVISQIPNLLKDINTGGGSTRFSHFTSLSNSNILFGVMMGPSAGLWVSDGSIIGTRLLKAAAYPFSPFMDYQQKKYFVGTTPNSLLWRSDGTFAGTDSIPVMGLKTPTSFTVVNNLLFFIGSTNTSGTELWRTDGTVAGTFMLKDIWSNTGNGLTGSSSAYNPYLGVYNNELYFLANDGIHGGEIWKSDGTTAGTVILKDIYPGLVSSNIRDFKVGNNGIYFLADNQINGHEPWYSDGTANNTHLIKDLTLGTASTYLSSQFYIIGNFAYFMQGNFVIKTDGSSANTTSLTLFSTTSNTVSVTKHDFRLLPSNNSLYLLFSKHYSNPNPPNYNDSIFVSTIDVNLTSNTILVNEELPYNFWAFPSFNLATTVGIVGSRFIYTFISGSSTTNLFVFDATTNCLAKQYSVGGGASPSIPTTFQLFGSKLYYPLSGGVYQEPAYFDFTTDSVYKLSSTSIYLNDQILSSNLKWKMEVFTVKGKHYFIGDKATANQGLEFYETDFTSTGTFLLKDIYPGITSYYGNNRINSENGLNGNLMGVVTSNNMYFVANDGVNGEELWSLYSFTPASVGLEENNSLANSIHLFPNPTNEFITIKSESYLKQISIYNTLGALVKNNAINVKKEIQLSLNELENGIYFVKIMNEKGIITKKIIKE